ncbi:MAG: ceramidase domain-containing protein [Thioalkalivibrionaceae bacterium]
MLNLYCERTGPEIWSEPLNAISNLGFFLAAYFALRVWQSSRRSGAALASSDERFFIALVTLTIAIGLGSTAWHLFATPWALALDVIPILLFMLTLMAWALARPLGLNQWVSALGVGLFFLSMIVVPWAWRALGWFNPEGSVGYAPAWLALLAIGGTLVLGARDRSQRTVGAWLGGAGVILTVSLVARSLDHAACDHVVIGGHAVGTHALWHLLNGAVLYACLRAVLACAGRAGVPSFEGGVAR